MKACSILGIVFSSVSLLVCWWLVFPGLILSLIGFGDENKVLPTVGLGIGVLSIILTSIFVFPVMR